VNVDTLNIINKKCDDRADELFVCMIIRTLNTKLMDIKGTKASKQDDAYIVQNSRNFQIKRRSRYKNNRTVSIEFAQR